MGEEQSSTSSAAPKQKKQRQRNRPRNKRNRLQDNEIQSPNESAMQKANSNPNQNGAADKTREQVMAEREAKKQAKLAKKQKTTTPTAVETAAATTKPATTIITEVEQTTITTKLTTTTTTTTKDNVVAAVAAATSTKVAPSSEPPDSNTGEKTRDQIKAEREAKKAAKQAAKTAKTTGNNNVDTVTQKLNNLEVAPSTAAPTDVEKKKPALSKAERRAIQEAQRAAKAQGQTKKPNAAPTADAKATEKKLPSVITTPAAAVKESKRESESPAKSPAKLSPLKTERECKVKLFNHLVRANHDASLFINDARVHPSIARLGVQYAERTIVGSNARCIAFLHALRQVVQDFETPAKKEFGRSLDGAVKYHVEHLNKCRPLAVSVSNAYKQFRNQLTQLPADTPETELKEQLAHFIDTYVENQIGKAAQAISSSMQEKITDGDVLLTFACSSLIQYILEEAKRRKVAFRVIVVDSRPFCEGQEMLRRLHAHGIPCTYVLINAVSYVMPEATKVLLGAHALLANGYVMARAGTAQVALMANCHNVPVLVCCETHKFSERFQTDAIVYNELCDPNQLVMNAKCCLNNWHKSRLTPLNLSYDITPPELVSAVVTEVAILPCTSVPVILRIKPEIGY
ncbi:translation initiation factor eIF-2B subunit delta isoform X1 [Drosophila albomicans]|uniref:Translation initiation factor eIF2B subunit delta n=2 Tax=Drosophila albomicans TaxID=7291 RepID=A0A9C6WFN5_DROAB|nr:translation initiation factor eIF-2B subunit delta isoform X1 [Drosophila albomicans]